MKTSVALVMALTFLCAPVVADSIMLDDFETGPMSPTLDGGKTLWNQYTGDPTEGPDPGVAAVTSDEAYDGESSLAVTVNGGNIYTQFFPKPSSLRWNFAREHIKSGDWEFDKYNRLRFWIKVPDGVDANSGGLINAHFGTYVRAKNGDPTSAEAGGNHYYHYFNLATSGQWHQVIIDTHPTHRRGANGGVEGGNIEYPTKEVGFNYFDALTRFYVDFKGDLPNYPSTYYMDGFEFYHEKNPENVDQIYTLHGVYSPNDNKVSVGWSRHKDENKVKHEVRYAFQDVFQIGWEGATPAPDGIVSPPGWQGYNGMEWSTSSIEMGEKQMIYIAIKPENSDLYRQIAIPLVEDATVIAPPNPPGSFRAVVQ